MLIEVKNINFKCDACNEDIAVDTNQYNVLINRDFNGNRKIKCPYCNYEFYKWCQEFSGFLKIEEK